ncbi:aminotransferase class V-fold PLP-dependent enzyme, partial [Bacteroidota bacterium]
KPFVYLDNAATTQKPKILIKRLSDFYSNENSSIHRAVNFMSKKATQLYEESREEVKKFINANQNSEIIFTSGATSSINLIANSFGEKFINKGDEIIISELEHHSNIVPWQIICKKKEAILRIIPLNEAGELNIEEYQKLLNKKTKIVAVSHASNSLGTINPVKEIIKLAHNCNIPVLIDGAQAVPHLKIDVQDLNCDFYVFSGHKIYGPTGIGVLFGKEKWLKEIPPYQGGGEMIKNVSFKKTTYALPPFKFEAGTTNYAGAIGLATAINYFSSLGIDNILKHEKSLLNYLTTSLSEIKNLRILGKSNKKIGVVSFYLENINPFDTGSMLDKMGIAVRTGTLCTQPVMDHYNIDGAVRVSLGLYNIKDEIDILIKALLEINEIFV